LAKNNDDVTRRTNVPGPLPPIEPRVAVLRLTPTGSVSGGSGPPDLIERVAYAAQLGDLIGELLGAGPFESLEISMASGACVIAREVSGNLVAASSPDGAADVVLLRRRMAALPERP
jgi:hypothetical protein